MSSIFWIIATVIGIAVACDVLFARIPNWLTFPAMVVGIVLHVWTAGIPGLVLSVSGLVIGFCIFLAFYILGGMGAGDIKLMAAVGALLGPRDVLFAAAFTTMAGGLYALTLLVLQNNNRKTLARYGAMVKAFVSTGHFVYVDAGTDEKTTRLRYAAAIGVGTLAAFAQKIDLIAVRLWW